MNGPPLSALGVVINGSAGGSNGGATIDLEDFEPQPRDRCNTWPLQKPAGDLGHHTSPLIHEEIPEEDINNLEDIDIDGSCDNLSTDGGYTTGGHCSTAIFQTGNVNNSNNNNVSNCNSGGGGQGGQNSAAAKKNNARRNAWGNLSYAELITRAILSSEQKRLTLAEIYDWFLKAVPYFRDKGDSNSSAGWKNSIRHNLSLHSRFMRIQNEGAGKSSWWVINPEAKPGKSSRRRTGSMEQAVKTMEKKRGRVKKKIDQIRASTGTLDSLGCLRSPSSADSTTDLYDSANNLNFQLSSNDFRPRSDSNLSNYSVASTSTNNHSRLSPRIEEPFDDWDLDHLRVDHPLNPHHHPLTHPHHVTPLLNGAGGGASSGLDAGYPDDLVDSLSQSMTLSGGCDQSQSTYGSPDQSQPSYGSVPDLLPPPPYPQHQPLANQQSQIGGPRNNSASSSSSSGSAPSYLIEGATLNDQGRPRSGSGGGDLSSSGGGGDSSSANPASSKISPRHCSGNGGGCNSTNQQQQPPPMSPFGSSGVTIKSEPPTYQELYPAGSSATPRVNSLPEKSDLACSHQMRLGGPCSANPMLRDVLQKVTTPSGGQTFRLIRPQGHLNHLQGHPHQHPAAINSAANQCSLTFLANRNLRQHLIISNPQNLHHHHQASHQQQQQHQLLNQGSDLGCSGGGSVSGLAPVTSSFFYPPISSLSAPSTMTSATSAAAAAMMMVNGVGVVGQLPMELSDIQYDHNYKSDIQCDIDQVIRHELRIAGRLEFTDFSNVKYNLN